MSGLLDGKVVVVTGGASGIGRGTSLRCAREGATVVIGDVQAEPREGGDPTAQLITAAGGTARFVGCDVRKHDDLESLMDAAEELGGVDVLVNNAGIFRHHNFLEAAEADFDAMFDINVKGVLFTVQQAVPLMADGGSIILTGSVAGSKGFESGAVYGATKAAIRSFARSWTSDLKARNIRVNVLSPGPIQTPGLDVFANLDVKNYLKSLVPLGRIGTSDEIAKAALFLASDDSSYVAGVELFVDGGSAAI